MELRELRKCRKLASWITNLSAIAVWADCAQRIREFHDQAAEQDLTARQAAVDRLRDFEKSAGSCLFRIAGVYDLSSGDWDISVLDDQLED